MSSALLGCVVGAYAAGWLADRQGRIKVMVLAAVLFVISAIGSGLAFSPWDLILWRVIGGLGVGAASVIAPAYIAEISPASIRGRMGSLQQLAIVTGIFIALLSDAFLAGVAGGAGKRAVVRSGGLALDVPRRRHPGPGLRHHVAADPGVAPLPGLQGRERQGALGAQPGPQDRHRRAHVARSGAPWRWRRARPSRTWSSQGSGGLLPIVWVGIALSVFQQFVGINVIFYYSSALWQQVGFSESDALDHHGDHVGDQHRGDAGRDLGHRQDRPPHPAADRVGGHGRHARHAGCGVRVGAGAATTSRCSATRAGIVALLAANLFVVFFGVSWGPVVWVLLGEMFNNKIRASALGLAAAAQWLANFAISTSFPKLADIGLAFAYGFYTFFAVLSFFFVAKFVKETKGRQLEDM